MKLNWNILHLLIILFFLGPPETRGTEHGPINQTIPSDPNKSLLWEISGNGLNSSSYLFGTIHLINSEDFFLPDGTLAAIDQCKEIVFEIDMDDMSDITKLMPLMNKIMMDDNLTLKDLMTAEDYTMIKDHFEEIGLPMFFIERIKPMFLYAFAGGDFAPDDLQSGHFKSYEVELSDIANSNNIEIGGLETIEYQISMFDSIDYVDQADMLIETIKSTDSGANELEELVQIYLDQDINGMHDMMKGDPGLTKYENLLLTSRNKNWIPLMKYRMQNQRTFFAVGAGHLGGPEGVINLLIKDGYTVRPVKSL